MRIEKDFLGSREIPEEALYGIHALRAKENFPDQTQFHTEWYKSTGLVKLACYETYERYCQALYKKYHNKNIPVRIIPENIINALKQAAEEVSEGFHREHFIIPAMQGGAGTSINMNINEIITNRALQIMGKQPGDYESTDPIEHANIFQSTNDVIPTSLKVSVIQSLQNLEEQINKHRKQIEFVENKYRNALRIGYTQMQEAVPSSFGKLFSTYNEALSRDWWRVSKAFERIKVVNLGGSAIGTGLTVPTYFIMEVVPSLQRLTGLPITRSENLPDTTSNLDSFVEVHAILKSHAVNLEKMVSDIRLLSSDLKNNKEITIPQQQVGSSIMPGKTNPVIPEFVISSMHKVYSNDSLVSGLCGQGNLELNAYLPVIGHAILESLKLLIAANSTIELNLIKGMQIETKSALKNLLKSPSIATALTPYIGYNKAGTLAKEMKKENLDIFEVNDKYQFLSKEKIQRILSEDNLLKLGFRINDLLD
jgi:aspartate ammonia-lyase